MCTGLLVDYLVSLFLSEAEQLHWLPCGERDLLVLTEALTHLVSPVHPHHANDCPLLGLDAMDVVPPGVPEEPLPLEPVLVDDALGQDGVRAFRLFHCGEHLRLHPSMLAVMLIE